MHVCIKCGRNISNTQKKQLRLPAIPDRVPRVGWRQVAILIAVAAVLWSTSKCSSALSLIQSRNDKLREKGDQFAKNSANCEHSWRQLSKTFHSKELQPVTLAPSQASYKLPPIPSTTTKYDVAKPPCYRSGTGRAHIIWQQSEIKLNFS